MKKNAIVIVLLVIIIEILIFNFDSLKSLFYKEIEVDKNEFALTNISYNKDTKKYTGKKSNSYIVIPINKKIKNIYIDIDAIEKDFVEIELEYTDDANANYNKYRSRGYSNVYHIVGDIEKSKYIDCNHLGKTGNIKINISSDTPYYINEISFNKWVTPDINLLRIILLFSITFIIYNYFKTNKLKEFINKHEKICFWIIVIIFCNLIAVLYANYSQVNIEFKDSYTTSYQEALMNGKLSFSLDDSAFSEIENIYDYTQRKIYDTPWDVSYYNGKFYMYFGILPNLILGIFNLAVDNAALLFSVITAIFLALLVKKIIERYFPKCSSGLKLLMVIFALFNSRLLILIPRTRYYELIVICGFCFSVIGMYMYYIFKENKKIRYLFLGSLLLCLAVACRSGMLLISVLGLLLVCKDLNKKNFIPYFIPYVVIGSILMYINYIRFGNIFEFGITYQLTVVDQSYLKMDINNIINGIYTYLFKMPNFIPQFPFVTNNVSMIQYNGFYFNTSNGNGILTMSILSFVLPFMYKKVDKKVLKVIISSVIIGLIIMTISNCFGGAVRRYTLEFAWLFVIPIVLLTINCLSKYKKTLIVLVMISCLMNFFIIFDNSNDDLGKLEENKFYYQVQNFVEP